MLHVLHNVAVAVGHVNKVGELIQTAAIRLELGVQVAEVRRGAMPKKAYTALSRGRQQVRKGFCWSMMRW